MNFCEDCDNMLYMHITEEEGKNVLKYFCRCCNNTYDHTKEDVAALTSFADDYFFGVPLEGSFSSLPQDQADLPIAFDWAKPS